MEAGTVFFGVRVPNWYFNNLSLAAFAAIVATEFWLDQRDGTVGPAYRRALGWAAISSTLVVALSFRRSLWLLLVAGLSLVAWRAFRTGRFSPRKVLAITLLGSLFVSILLVSIGTEALAERISSINPTSDNRLAATNSDHLGDIADAWDVVNAEPDRRTWRGVFLRDEPHRGLEDPIVRGSQCVSSRWLKFGVFGLIVYIGFHVRWIMGFFKAGRVGWLAGSVGAGIYLLADQVPASIQTWAYGSFQLSIQRGILLAALLVAVIETDARALPATKSSLVGDDRDFRLGPPGGIPVSAA